MNAMKFTSGSKPMTTDQMSRAELVSLDPHGALISEINDWPGTVDENAVRRRPNKANLVLPAIGDLIQAKLVRVVPVWRTSRNRFLKDPERLPRGEFVVGRARMLYHADDAATYLHNRDGFAVNGLRLRHNGALNQDHRERRPHRSHTGQLDDVVTDLTLQGFTLRSGRRDRVQYRGLPQLAPDAVMTAKVALGTVAVVYIDALLEGGVKLNVQRVLAPHLYETARGAERLVIMECRNDRSARIAREEAIRLVRENGTSLWALAVSRPLPSLSSGVQALAENFPDQFITVEFFIEYERSARHPERVRKKLWGYVEYAKHGHQFPLIFITETDQVERFVLEESEALMVENRIELTVVTSTYGKITGRLPDADREVWSHRGIPIVLLPVGIL